MNFNVIDSPLLLDLLLRVAGISNQSTEETSARHKKQDTSHHVSRISVEATDRPTLSTWLPGLPAGLEGQVRDPGTHSSPSRNNTMVAPPAARGIQQDGDHTAERAAGTNRAPDSTAFRNLFKTFDTRQ